MPGAIDADVVPRQHLGAAARSEPERLPGGHRLRPAAPARDEQRLPDVVEEVAALVRRRAVDAEPDAHARVRSSPAPARRPLRGGGSTSGSARRRCRSPRSGRSRRPRGGRSGRTRRRRRASRASRGTRPACSRTAPGSTPPPRPSPRGACAAAGRGGAPGPADSVIRRPVTENGEQGATAIWTRAPGPVSCSSPARRSVSASTASISSTSSSGGKPAVGDAEVHRAARGDEPAAELLRGLHLGLDQPRAAAREDVVVVEDGRAAGEHQLRDAGARRRVLRLGVDPRPRRVELDEPLEEGGLLRAGARERLVEVVVRVDEARRDDRAAQRDALVRLRRRAAAGLEHEAVLDQDPAVRVLGLRVVHRDDVRVGEQGLHGSVPYRCPDGRPAIRALPDDVPDAATEATSLLPRQPALARASAAPVLVWNAAAARRSPST